jgi:hypothetical protein
MKYLLALGLLGMASASDTSCRVTLTVDFKDDEISKNDGSTDFDGSNYILHTDGQILVCEGDTLITTINEGVVDNSAVTIVDADGYYTDQINQNVDGSWTFPSGLKSYLNLRITYDGRTKGHFFIGRESGTTWDSWCVNNIIMNTRCPSYCNWDVDTNKCNALPTNDTSTSDPGAGTDCQALADSNDAEGYIEAQCCSC